MPIQKLTSSAAGSVARTAAPTSDPAVKKQIMGAVEQILADTIR